MNLILRVDDVGWTQDKHRDTGLEYFQRWRDTFGIKDLPVVYGCIPTMFEQRELEWLRDNLTEHERIAVHGWDHERGAELRVAELERSRDYFQICDRDIDSYIAPFNVYSDQTVVDWGSIDPGGMYFFGGFNGEDHYYGDYPVFRKGAIHLPAFKPLYDRAGPVLDRLPEFAEVQCPLVVTLHVTWDGAKMEALRPLRDAIAEHLVPVESVEDWLDMSRLDLNELTGPHFAAYQWVLDRVKIGQTVLDVGSRYSLLPSLMALRGCKVMASDMDLGVHDQQEAISAKYGVKVGSACIDFVEPVILPREFDVITACWALQHNMPPERQSDVVWNLAGALKPGGRLIIISSFSPSDTFQDLIRPDPQAVLNWSDVQKFIIGPSGLQLAEVAHFKYNHGDVSYNFCAPSLSNAVCYTLEKPQ